MGILDDIRYGRSSMEPMVHRGSYSEGSIEPFVRDYLERYGDRAWERSVSDRVEYELRGEKAPEWLSDTNHYLNALQNIRTVDRPWLRPIPLVYNWGKRMGLLTDDTTSSPTRSQLRAGYGLLR